MRLASPSVIATGFRWAEGPLWVDRLGGLLVSDTKANTISLVRPGDGDAWHKSVFLRPAGLADPHTPGVEHGSNGLALDADGQVVLCSHGERGVFVLDEDRWTKKPLALRYGGHRLNSPNDLALHASGALYVTDPTYGLSGGLKDPRRELDVCGVYRIDPESGAVRLATDAVEMPNGIAFSPDGETAYVSCSDPEPERRWLRFDVQPDGTFGPGDVLLRADGFDGDGVPDGLTVAADGTLIVTAPGGLLLLAPDGEVRDRIELDRAVSNVTFGQHGQALFATATDRVLRFPIDAGE